MGAQPLEKETRPEADQDFLAAQLTLPARPGEPRQTMKQVLLTGGGGFLGRHLAARMKDEWSVTGAGRSLQPPEWDRAWVRVEHECRGLAETVVSLRPDLVIHAAFLGPQQTQRRHDYLPRLIETNSRLFEACALQEVPVIVVGSSAVYGSCPSGSSLTETSRPQPVSLYGIAKIAQEMLAEEASFRGLDYSVVRLFNLIGPGDCAGTVVHDWASRVLQIARGKAEALRVKNLATSRDFVDVRDACDAIALVATGFRTGSVFNVATGKAVSLRELCDELRKLSGVSYETVQANAVLDRQDVKFQRGDSTKLRAAYGWSPQIPWQQSVRDLWEYLRANPVRAPDQA